MQMTPDEEFAELRRLIKDLEHRVEDLERSLSLISGMIPGNATNE